VWFVAIGALLFVAAGYYLWRGFIGYFESGGDITAPVTATAAVRPSATVLLPIMQTTLPAFDFVVASPTPPRECLMFRVIPIKARIRECPDESCRTLEQRNQNTQICVYGPALNAPQYPQATLWYEINIAPRDPLPRLGFMHSSVLDAIKPTRRPTRTPIPTLTLTPSETLRPTRTLTPSETLTPIPTDTLDPFLVSPTPTPSRTPTPTPTLPLRSA
jgi:hypothetical protein